MQRESLELTGLSDDDSDSSLRNDFPLLRKRLNPLNYAAILLFFICVLLLISFAFSKSPSKSSVTQLNESQSSEVVDEFVNVSNSQTTNEVLISEKVDGSNDRSPSTSEPICAHGHQLPTIFIVQAQKCATSTMNALIKKLGVVGAINCNRKKFISCEKEPHFFDHHRKFKLHDERYAKIFPKCGEYEYVIDATPNYESQASAIRKMYTNEEASQLKFIHMVCDPVKRLESAWNHCASSEFSWGDGWDCKKRNGIDKDLMRQSKDLSNLYDLGKYGTYLNEFRTEFEDNQFILVLKEYFVKNQRKSLEVIANILGLEMPENMEEETRNRREKKESMGEEVKETFVQYYRQHVEQMREFIMIDEHSILIPNDFDEFMHGCR